MLKKYKQLIAGIVIGGILATAGSALAGGTSVAAILATHIKFKFDGVQKQVPQGFTVLSYQGRTYVPAKFVAEQLGAQVGWDAQTSTVTINKKGTVVTPAPAPTTSGQKVGIYTFSNYSLDDSNPFATRIISEVTNTSKQSKTLIFKVNLYDNNGNLLDTATGSVQDLGAGQKKSIEAYATKKVSGVAKYTFQIEMDY